MGSVELESRPLPVGSCTEKEWLAWAVSWASITGTWGQGWGPQASGGHMGVLRTLPSSSSGTFA